jgi:hypothetical protein
MGGAEVFEPELNGPTLRGAAIDAQESNARNCDASFSLLSINALRHGVGLEYNAEVA